MLQYEIAAIAGRGGGRFASVGQAGRIHRTTVKFARPDRKMKGTTVDRTDQLRREHDFAKGIRDSRSEADRSFLEKVADFLEEWMKWPGGS
jgi:hypothetical protein